MNSHRLFVDKYECDLSIISLLSSSSSSSSSSPSSPPRCRSFPKNNHRSQRKLIARAVKSRLVPSRSTSGPRLNSITTSSNQLHLRVHPVGFDINRSSRSPFALFEQRREACSYFYVLNQLDLSRSVSFVLLFSGGYADLVPCISL